MSFDLRSNLDDNPFAAGTDDAEPIDWMDEITFTLFSFDGRIGRVRYWVTHFSVVIAWAVAFFAAILAFGEELSMLFVVISMIPLIWIGLAIEIKRWHDMGLSGWWVLVGLIPYVGALIKLVMLGFVPGDSIDNDYGPVPRGF